MAKKTYARPRYDSPFNRESTGTRFQFADVSGAFTQQFNQARIDEEMLVRALLVAKRAHIKKFYFDSTKFDDSPEMTEDFRKIDVHEFVAATTYVKRVDFEQKKVVETKRKERFNSRMNIKKGNVSTRLGYGLNVNYETGEVEYYIFLLYTNAGKSIGRNVDELIDFTKYNLMPFRKGKLADTSLAIELQTPNLQKFIGFAKYDFDESRTVQFLEKDIMREYNAVVKKGNIKQLRTFYEIVPIPLLQFIPDEDLARDFFFMLKLDEISSVYDTSDTMLSIMYAISDLKQLYDYTMKYPDKVLDVYRSITNDELRGEYCDFLTALGYVYQSVDLENIKTVWSGEQYIINSDIIFDAKSRVRIEQLYNRKKRVKNPFQTTAEFVNGQNEYGYEYALETWSDENFHPMEMMLLKNMDNGEVDFVSAIQVKYIADRDEWDFVAKMIFSVLNIVSIMVSFGVLIKGAVGLIRFLAVADIVISTTDQALENDDFKKSLAESGEAGKWFVENWGTISLISSLGIMSWETAYNIHKHGDKIIAFFKNSRKNPRYNKIDHDGVIEEMENLKKEADKRMNRKIDNFISRGVKNGKKIGDIPKKAIVRELKNVTPKSTEVSRALSKNKIKLIKLDEDDFFNTIKKPGEKLEDIKDVVASQIEEVIYLKNDSSLDKAFGEIVHEGQHAFDYRAGLFSDSKRLREETKLITHDKVSMKSYVDKMTDNQIIELRARIAEREFQMAAKQNLDFNSVEAMISDIFKKY